MCHHPWSCCWKWRLFFVTLFGIPRFISSFPTCLISLYSSNSLLKTFLSNALLNHFILVVGLPSYCTPFYTHTYKLIRLSVCMCGVVYAFSQCIILIKTWWRMEWICEIFFFSCSVEFLCVVVPSYTLSVFFFLLFIVFTLMSTWKE